MDMFTVNQLGRRVKAFSAAFALVAVIAVFSIDQHHSHADEATAPLKLVIKPNKYTFRIGDRIELICTLVNLSSYQVSLPVLFVPEHHFVRFEIVAPDGSRIIFRGPERKVKISVDNIVLLAPNMFVGMTIDITGQSLNEKWYELEDVGEYIIQAVYEVPTYWRVSLGRNDLWAGKVMSEPIVLSVSS